MTTKNQILGTEQRCLWYMELHYGSSFKGRDVNSFPCPNCKGYDFGCEMYQPIQHGYLFKAIEKQIQNRLEIKRNKTLETEVHRHD